VKIDRRTLLRGAGTVAIGLPLLDEMRPRSLRAAPNEPPVRAITIFFGEGCPTHVQEAHLSQMSGPFEPLAKFKAKLAPVRGVGLPPIGGAHQSGGMCSFNGVPFVSLDRAGGPSIDQVILQEKYPQGLPAGMIPTIAMGFYGSYRDSEPNFRRVRSWRNDGTPSEVPKAYPSALFTRIFGAMPSGSGGEAQEKEKRRRKSVLDAVVAQYKSLTSEGSPLGAASRAKVASHLEKIREYEIRAFGGMSTGTGCKVDPVADPLLYRGQRSFNGVNLTVDDITAHWRLNVDLTVMALRCDLARFASVNFLNCGDRIDLKGEYRYDGRLIYTFDDSRDRPGAAESEAVNHEHFHAWDRPGNAVAPHHMHFYMREVGYLLGKLDDPAFKDPNGGTLLDNAMVMISTELSEPGAHAVSNMLHIVNGAGGRLRTGAVVRAGDGRREAVDLYNTVLRAYGISRTMGGSRFGSEIAGLRV
jgi:hypothetical protein